jgi:Mor family transcriptional regulator
MRTIDQYKDEITIEDLPETYRLIAEKCGLNTALEIAYLFGGVNIYFPKPEQIIQDIRDKRIVKEFDGENYNQLAKKYNLSTSWVREIINRARAADRQTNIFDYVKE